MPAQETRSLTSLLTHTVSELAYLVQTEVRLARAEMSEKASQAAHGATYIGAGAVLLLVGLIGLLFAAVNWLAVAGVREEWGFLAVGAGVLIVGLILTAVGRQSIRAKALMPERTANQVRADVTMAKEQIR